jgi:hypothetical protein
MAWTVLETLNETVGAELAARPADMRAFGPDLQV